MSDKEQASPVNTSDHSDTEFPPASERRVPICSGCKQAVKGHRAVGLQPGPQCTGMASTSHVTAGNTASTSPTMSLEQEDNTSEFEGLQAKQKELIHERQSLLQQRARRALESHITQLEQEVATLRVDDATTSHVQQPVGNSTRTTLANPPSVTTSYHGSQLTLDTLRQNMAANQVAMHNSLM